ncbi:MAG: DUF4197 domain-containing protein [Amphritea sp.]
MKKLSSALLVCAVISAPVYAGFGDFIKDLEETGKEILQEQSSQPDSQSDSTTNSAAPLDYNTLVSGLKEALDVGSRRAIEEVSKPDGYFNNQQIRIPLPNQLEQVSSVLRQFGLGDQVDQFELSMNRAAEQAAPQATEIIVNAIKDMSIEDAQQVLNGPDNAATEYFREKTSDQLTELFLPSVKNSMNQVGVTRYYGELTQEAEKVPMVGDMAQDFDLENYVTQGALDGLFTMLAAEEKLIRENPAARTTDLLKQVFNL